MKNIFNVFGILLFSDIVFSTKIQAPQTHICGINYHYASQALSNGPNPDKHIVCHKCGDNSFNGKYIEQNDFSRQNCKRYNHLSVNNKQIPTKIYGFKVDSIDIKQTDTITKKDRRGVEFNIYDTDIVVLLSPLEIGSAQNFAKNLFQDTILRAFPTLTPKLSKLSILPILPTLLADGLSMKIIMHFQTIPVLRNPEMPTLPIIEEPGKPRRFQFQMPLQEFDKMEISIVRGVKITLLWPVSTILHPVHIKPQKQTKFDNMQLISMNIVYDTNLLQTTFVVPQNYHGKLFYFCANHDSMGVGSIMIEDEHSMSNKITDDNNFNSIMIEDEHSMSNNWDFTSEYSLSDMHITDDNNFNFTFENMFQDMNLTDQYMMLDNFNFTFEHMLHQNATCGVTEQIATRYRDIMCTNPDTQIISIDHPDHEEWTNLLMSASYPVQCTMKELQNVNFIPTIMSEEHKNNTALMFRDWCDVIPRHNSDHNFRNVNTNYTTQIPTQILTNTTTKYVPTPKISTTTPTPKISTTTPTPKISTTTPTPTNTTTYLRNENISDSIATSTTFINETTSANSSYERVFYVPLNNFADLDIKIHRGDDITLYWPSEEHPVYLTNNQTVIWGNDGNVIYSQTKFFSNYNFTSHKTNFIVPLDYNGELFYFCKNHASMKVGVIQFMDKAGIQTSNTTVNTTETSQNNFVEISFELKGSQTLSNNIIQNFIVMLAKIIDVDVSRFVNVNALDNGRRLLATTVKLHVNIESSDSASMASGIVNSLSAINDTQWQKLANSSGIVGGISAPVFMINQPPTTNNLISHNKQFNPIEEEDKSYLRTEFVFFLVGILMLMIGIWILSFINWNKKSNVSEKTENENFSNNQSKCGFCAHENNSYAKIVNYSEFV